MFLLLLITCIVAQEKFMILMYKDTLKLSLFNPQNMTTNLVKDFGINDYCSRGNCVFNTNHKSIYFLIDFYLYDVNFKGITLSYMEAPMIYPRIINDVLYGLVDNTIAEFGYRKFYPKYTLPNGVYEIFGYTNSENTNTVHVWFNYDDGTNVVTSLKNWNVMTTYYFPINLEGLYLTTNEPGNLIYFIGINRLTNTNEMYTLNLTNGNFDISIIYYNTSYLFAAEISDSKIYSVMESNLIYGVYFWVVTDLRTMKYYFRRITLDSTINCIGII